jgi:hypothetical protein
MAPRVPTGEPAQKAADMWNSGKPIKEFAQLSTMAPRDAKAKYRNP